VGSEVPHRHRGLAPAWDRVIPFFAFPPAVRRVIYTTNAIESIHSQLRKIIKTAGALPQRRCGHQADLAGAAQHHRRLGRAAKEWREAMNQFAIAYGDRFTRSTPYMIHRLAHRVGRSSQATTAAVTSLIPALHTEIRTTPQIAVLSRSDAPSYRSLMLEAYAANADAYTSTVEERASELLSWWENRIGSPEASTSASARSMGANSSAPSRLSSRSSPRLVIPLSFLACTCAPPGAAAESGVNSSPRPSKPRAAARDPTSPPHPHRGKRLSSQAVRGRRFTVWGTEPLAIRATSGFKSKVHMAMLLAHAKTAA